MYLYYTSESYLEPLYHWEPNLTRAKALDSRFALAALSVNKTESLTKTSCSKCFIVSVISFLVYFDKQVHKKLEKNEASKKKNFKP